MSNTAEIMERGLDCLLENLGVIETERFISAMLREQFDYTKWHRSAFPEASVEILNEKAVAWARAHPFKANKARNMPE